MPDYPQRTQNHNIEELSERFFNSCLPENWYSHKPNNDYGVDLIVDIFEDTNATGLELLVQLKASDSTTTTETETVVLRTTTYNFLWEKLQVVMVVKYVIPDDEAYWILLKDVQSPNQDNDSFTIHIPKDNKLSDIDWNGITSYIREVTDRKLAAQRTHIQETRNRK